jgi:hypothetical protein
MAGVVKIGLERVKIKCQGRNCCDLARLRRVECSVRWK